MATRGSTNGPAPSSARQGILVALKKFAFGLLFAAILLIPRLLRLRGKPRRREEKARELGALVIVSGGEYQSAGSAPAAVELFVAPDTVWALDSSLRPLFSFPVAQLRGITVLPGDFQAALILESSTHAVRLVYRGFFAGHLAAVAASTLQGLQPSPLPILRPVSGSSPDSRDPS